VSIDNKNIRMHRLVAMTFLDNLENKEQVNHKDGNKTNNRLDNLEWVTARGNSEHSNGKHIIQYDMKGNFIKEWDYVLEAAYSLGKKTGAAITEVCNGKRKSIYGYVWKYKS
jgi:hypothetical protein